MNPTYAVRDAATTMCRDLARSRRVRQDDCMAARISIKVYNCVVWLWGRVR